jgi:CDP-diacylglycerol--glycerol-3-phosphate 3-phosphatidyltransferase
MSNLPLILTTIRFFGALCFPFLMIAQGSSSFLGVLYVFLAITDWLDGITARWYGESSLGRLLDPLADKFLVVGPLLIFAVWARVSWYIVALVIFRELFVATLREYCSEEGISLPVQRIGKLKTVVQMTYTTIIFFCLPLPSSISFFLDCVVLCTTTVSALWYGLLVYQQKALK